MSKTRDLANLADLNFDSGTMVVDKANDKVGIGTASPATYGGKLNITDGSVGGETTLVVANNNANQFIRMGINADVAQIAYDNADSLAFGIATDSTTSGLTTERMRIDSSGNVGIGTTSPDKKLHIEAEPPVFRMTNPQTSSSLGLSMGKIEWETRDASATGVIGYIDVVDSNNFGTTFDMAFATGQSGSATERLRILSTGGITFNGDTAAANALDDYEEGTWTPEVRASSGTVLSASTKSGHYTKIGRLVHVNCDITNIVTTGATSSNAISVHSLPFTVDQDLSFGSCVSSVVTLQNSRTQITARANTGNYIEFFANGSGQGFTNVDVGDLSSGVSDLYFSVAYYTDQ